MLTAPLLLTILLAGAGNHGTLREAPTQKPIATRTTGGAFGASGIYDAYLFGVKKGVLRFETLPDGSISCADDSRIDASATARISLDSKGAISQIELVTAGPPQTKVTYRIEGNGIVRKTDSGETTLPRSEGIYSSLYPVTLRSLLARFSSPKAGWQTISVTDLLSGKPRTVMLKLDPRVRCNLGAETVDLALWRLTALPTSEAVVYTRDGLPVYWRVPALDFELVLRGYESLRPSYRYRGLVSPPRFDVTVDRNVWVTMRDGIRLMADVYRPSAPGRYPVLLQRSPYGREEFTAADGDYFAQRGYGYVSEDVRGRGGSEGDFEYCRNEAKDGYDTLKWCAAQSWSNGRIGTLGASYNGYVQWMAATLHPPWLKAMISTVAMPGAPDGAPWMRGIFYPAASLGWFGLLRDRKRVQLFNQDLTAAANKLPIMDADVVAFGKPVPGYRAFLRPNFDSYVQRGSYRYDIGKIDLPVLHVSGWFDTVGIGTKLNWLGMNAHGARNQKLVFGPWSHLTNRESTVGDLDFGPDGYIDLHTLYLRWFDRWLKGIRNGIDTEPRVDAFLLGENRWTHADDWPPKSVRPTRWYLRKGKRLSSAPPKREGSSGYVYDPAEWVAGPKLGANYEFGTGSDASQLCAHKGQVLFESSPLSKPITLNGPVTGRLFAATSATDTDWAMALMDVSREGKAIPLCAGIVRARYRRSLTHPTPVRHGKVVAYDIDLWQTAIRIPAGHKLRVAVLSTLFPDTDRNLNGGDNPATATRIVVAHQRIFHDSRRASFITLPILP